MLNKSIIFIAINGVLLSGTIFATPKSLEIKAITAPSYTTTLKTTIDLSDSSESEIRGYYSDLKSKSAEELSGQNLLKNLKPILMDGMEYFSYDNIWKIYEITDRDWAKSPASGTTYGTYNAATNKLSSYQYGSNSNPKNNPYVHARYRNYKDYAEQSNITAWGDHNATGINREHIWCQSRGFKAPSEAEGPAGTDLHHLEAADGRVNQTHHNNNPYGNVNVEDSDSKKYGTQYPFMALNKRGSAKKTSSDDECNVVFEPQDSDKGDIARACFYMVARYNNLSGSDTITQYEPNLTLVDHATSNGESEESSATHAVAMGILSDLLEWNALDPVDEYEIHRNNLIYKNYQNNRNPFIDFPEWADYIWGDKQGTPVNPDTDPLNAGSDYKPQEGGNGINIPMWVWIVAAVVVVAIVTIIIILLVKSKKFRKQAKKSVKKSVKKQIKSSRRK